MIQKQSAIRGKHKIDRINLTFLIFSKIRKREWRYLHFKQFFIKNLYKLENCE
jgi:hypothetical protein